MMNTYDLPYVSLIQYINISHTQIHVIVEGNKDSRESKKTKRLRIDQVMSI